MGTWIVLAVVVAIVALAINSMLKNRKKGGSFVCSDCPGCASAGSGCACGPPPADSRP